MSSYAKVRFPSALPALDKEFDYKIPNGMNLKFGNLVEVPFGAGGKTKQGIVVGVSDKSSFADSALEVSSLVTDKVQLNEEQLSLCKAVAARSCGSVGELLKYLLPKRIIKAESVTFETKSLVRRSETELFKQVRQSKRLYLQYKGISAYRNWDTDLVELARCYLAEGKSVLAVLPDFRDLQILEKAIESSGLQDFSIRHSAEDSNQVRYSNYLRALNQVSFSYGLRGTSFAPTVQTGLLFLLDDGDESHFELNAPYWNSREVLLQRQQLSNSEIVFASKSPSSEVVRLLDLKYLEKQDVTGSTPLIRITSNTTRLDDESFGLISKNLRAGNPVLIQVANLGFASAVACRKCSEIRECHTCQGRLWIDPRGQLRCRSCKSADAIGPCSCGGDLVKPIKTGSNGLVSWLEKAFPETPVIHSSAAERLTEIPDGASVIIATPGAEPNAANGYAVVLLADANSMLGAPNLRSLERSCLQWANALGKLSETGIGIIVGVTGTLADDLKKMDFWQVVKDDYEDRKQLGLPPETRIASVTCSNLTDLESFRSLMVEKLQDKAKLSNTGNPQSKAIIYRYADGNEVAEALRTIDSVVSSKSKARKPGQRLFRIAMDDWQVI